MKAPPQQGMLFERPAPTRPEDLLGYDHYVIAFSGGKDSLACLLSVLEAGVDRVRVELWHHAVDGREGSDMMDWPCTPAYCEAVARAFDLPIYFSWKRGGFEREMLREEDFTADVLFETPSGLKRREAKKQERYRNTRRRFPQVSANLNTRWCSSYLKIQVAAAALRGQERFRGARTLFITGERAEESTARRQYASFEPHRADLRDGKNYTRHIDHWRPVHHWTEHQVWTIVERWRVNPHPCYHLGYGRCSCLWCIFASADQFATGRMIAPERFAKLPSYENEFGVTMKRDVSLPDLAGRGRPYEAARGRMVAVALSETYDEPIFVDEWTLPPGAFGESCGPT